MTAIAMLLLAIVPLAEPARETFDVIEVNHFYDGEGRLIFSQVIFYDWDQGSERYQIRDWRRVKAPEQYPRRDWDWGGYGCVWYDGDLLRVTRCRSIRETWTQFDVELVEREFLPQEFRRGLMRAGVAAKP